MDKCLAWLATTPYKDFTLTIASSDASFRKYYRLSQGDSTLILMDASLEKNSLPSFVAIDAQLRSVGVLAPLILEQDLEKGYLILEDFGATHYLDLLNQENFKELYSDAIETIIAMQKASTTSLPLYDKAFLHFEMDLMHEWYIKGLLKKELSTKEQELLQKSLDAISEVVLSQPQDVFVHRDFHSRNIMRTCYDSLGVIDFQDAMNGAITYDLVSLLKDCYIAYEPNEIEKLALTFRDKKSLDVNDALFIKWFDFMGMQRHIKVLGVFARLFLRDGKDGYLKDIPLTLAYTLQAAKKYDETRELALLLESLQ